jgi:hypothetical protein
VTAGSGFGREQAVYHREQGARVSGCGSAPIPYCCSPSTFSLESSAVCDTGADRPGRHAGRPCRAARRGNEGL